MKKSTIIWLIVATTLIVIGIATIFVALSMGAFDPAIFNTVELVTNIYEIEEEFDSISIFTETADIELRPSTDGSVKVECFEQKNTYHSISVNEGCLTIQVIDKREWFEHIGFYPEETKITVYLPKGRYNELTIKESTGDVIIQNEFEFFQAKIHVTSGDIEFFASAENNLGLKTYSGDITVDDTNTTIMTLVVGTGDINVNNIRCKIFETLSTTGDQTIKNLIAEERIIFRGGTGDVLFEKCDAPDITIYTNTGDIFGSLMSGKDFEVECGTGDVAYPESLGDEKCKVKSRTGDIKITIIPNKYDDDNDIIS